MAPCNGWTSPKRTLKRVVFPEPFGPKTPTNSPLRIENVASLQIGVSPYPAAISCAAITLSDRDFIARAYSHSAHFANRLLRRSSIPRRSRPAAGWFRSHRSQEYFPAPPVL